MNSNHKLTEEKASILGISIPFTKAELNSSFRELAFKHHPDTGGNAKKFIEINEAYEHLLPFAAELELDKEYSKSITIEKDIISNLGKGLGDLVNSNDCARCKGKGWDIVNHTSYVFDHECRVCHGSGYVGDRGSRLFSYTYWERACPLCFGSGGTGRRTITKHIYHTCYKCKGTGQIEIFNPVLPKNRTISKIKNKQTRHKKSYCGCGALLKDDKCWRCKQKLSSY